MDGAAADALPARPSATARARAGRQHRLLMWSAPDVVLRVWRRDVRAGAGRGVQSARRAGARPLTGLWIGCAAHSPLSMGVASAMTWARSTPIAPARDITPDSPGCVPYLSW
jgi:hypothetical protein